MNTINRKLKKILVATDFSSTAEFALRRAIELAKVNNAKITVLHIIEKKNMDNLLDKYLTKLLPGSLWLTTEEYYLNLLTKKINSVANHQINIKKIILPKGKPANKILSYANKLKFDLLVIGAHGKYSIRDTFVGTTAEYISSKTKCPVLIIKNKPNKFYNNILVPIDFSQASKNALNLAMCLFPDKKIEMLHIGDYEYENLLQKEAQEENIPKNKLIKLKKVLLSYLTDKMDKFKKSIKTQKHKLTYTLDLGYPAPIILKESERKNKDLIVMGTRGHGKVHYLFKGRVSHVVLRETIKDILLVPPTS